MDCNHCEKLFDQYMDGEPEPGAASNFEEHVSSCQPCAQMFADFIKIKKGLSSLEDEPVPVGFRSLWTDKLYKPAQTKSKKWPSKVLPAFAAGIAAVAIFSALLLAGVLAPGPSLRLNSAVSQGSSAVAGGVPDAPDLIAPEAGSPSAFMAPAPPGAQAVPNTKSAADSAAVIPVTVSSEAFNNILNAFQNENIDYSQNGDQLTAQVTDDNQSALTSIFKNNGIMQTPVPGETYNIAGLG